MNIYQVITMTVFAVIGIKGGRMLSTLYAVELGASPFNAGLLIATYAVFPLLLAVHAGRIADRYGVRLPLLAGSAGMCAGVLLPYFVRGLPAVYAGAAITGTAFIFLQVSMHALTGALGEGAARTRNFSLFSLGMSVSDFLGPVMAGLAIDHLGHRKAFLYLGASSVTAVLVVLYFFRRMPRVARTAGGGQAQRAFDLVGIPDLRRIFLASGLVMTGIDLFQLYLPLYGHSIGMSATAIGLVMGACAAASFVVRIAIPSLVKRFTEEGVLLYSLFLSAAAFSLIPVFSHAWMLGAVSFGLGLGLGLGQPLTLVLTYNFSPAGRAGEALGLRLTMNNLAHVVMPVLFGIMGSVLGLSWVFWITAALLVFGGHFSRKKNGRMGV